MGGDDVKRTGEYFMVYTLIYLRNKRGFIGIKKFLVKDVFYKKGY